MFTDGTEPYKAHKFYVMPNRTEVGSEQGVPHSGQYVQVCLLEYGWPVDEVMSLCHTYLKYFSKIKLNYFVL